MIARLFSREPMSTGGTDGARPAPQKAIVFAAVAMLAGLSFVAFEAGGRQASWAAALGALAGFALYHAAFGFTAGWRRFIRERRGAAIRAQCLAIGVTALAAFPLMAWGTSAGLPVWGFVFPLGVMTVAGAFLFGLGMQLGGGCGSGTLFTVGGGSTRMIVTLSAFVAGSFVATLHWPFWTSLPALPATSLPGLGLGVVGGLALTVALLAGIALLTARAERRRHGALEPPRPMGSVLHGPWSLTVGALALAVVGILTLIALGRPWGITSAFALWGAKIADGLGVPVADIPYWSGQMAAVERTVFADTTSVMDFGIILGALAAAGAAGRFAPARSVSTREVWTALAGGLLMGYGARLAFGCNIGGLMGGIVSGSLHGWSWLVFGFLGSMVGVWLRGRIGMDPPTAAMPSAAGGAPLGPPAG